MKIETKLNVIVVATAMIVGTSTLAQERATNPLVEKLGGSKLKQKQSGTQNQKPRFTTRGKFTPRGQVSGGGSKDQPAVETKKRTVIFTPRGLGNATSRGVASATSVKDTPIKEVDIKQIEAPASNPNRSSKGDIATKPGEKAYEMTYEVDPTSQLKGEIKFVKGSTEIVDSDSLRFLVQLGDAINQLDGMKFVIEGHASADGSAGSNQNLSQDRANKIFDMLIGGRNGVDENRLLPVGYGESEARFPASANDRILAEDRRVLIYQLID